MCHTESWWSPEKPSPNMAISTKAGASKRGWRKEQKVFSNRTVYRTWSCVSKKIWTWSFGKSNLHRATRAILREQRIQRCRNSEIVLGEIDEYHSLKCRFPWTGEPVSLAVTASKRTFSTLAWEDERAGGMLQKLYLRATNRKTDSGR